MSQSRTATPDRRALRSFGLQLGGLIAGVFGLVLPLIWGLGIPLWPWIIGGALVAWALAAPQSLAPLNRFWMGLALVLQRFVNPIVLAVIYASVFVPAGVLLRLFGHDPMRRRLDRATASYRAASTSAPPEHMKRPF
ncbi:MAG: sxtJ [Rhodospirillales bacterium]|nr:sxtJ [Rhodospirillales bacterium]